MAKRIVSWTQNLFATTMGLSWAEGWHWTMAGEGKQHSENGLLPNLQVERDEDLFIQG